MPPLLKLILDWSEVWALLIPLTVLIWKWKIRAEAMPLAIYVCIALVLNVLQDYIWKYQLVFFYSTQPGDNRIFYHIHSIVRLLLFSWFFIQLKQPFLHKIKRVVPIVFAIIAIVNYTLFESIFTQFSSGMLSIEALGILFYCMVYFLNLLIEEEGTSYKKNATFWMVTGISIYVVINFPIFIFYKWFSENAKIFAIDIWDLHNITYIMLCSFMAKYFYTESHE
jgi:hypothetical protein